MHGSERTEMIGSFALDRFRAASENASAEVENGRPFTAPGQEQWFAGIEPAQRDSVRLDDSGPEVAWIARLGEWSSAGEHRVEKIGVEQARYGWLQPPRRRELLSVNAPALFRQLASQVKDAAGTTGGTPSPSSAAQSRRYLVSFLCFARCGMIESCPSLRILSFS